MQQSNSNQAPKKTFRGKKGQNKRRKWKANIVEYIWCPSCKVYLQNSNAMNEHEKSMIHISNKNKEGDGRYNPNVKQKDQQKPSYRTVSGPKTVHLEYNTKNLWHEICEAEGIKGANFLFAATNEFICRPCQVTKHVTEILEHVHGPEHQETINLEINLNENHKLICEEEQLWERVHPSFRSHQTYVRIQDEKHMFCFLCEKNVPAANTHNLLDHIAGKNHMKNMIVYLQSIHSMIIGPYLNPVIQSLLQFTNSKCKEMKIFEMIIEPKDDTHLRKLHSLLNEINTDEKKTFCYVRCTCTQCDMEFDSGTLWLNHMNETVHKQNVENLNKSALKIGKYVCSVCNLLMFGKESDHHCIHNELVPPRVVISEYDMEAKLEDLYDVLKTYGTITDCALTPWEAIFEFQERESICDVLQNRVTFQGDLLNIEPLKIKERQVEKDLPPLARLNKCVKQIFSSMENFNSKVKSLCEIIDSTSNQNSDNLARFLEEELSKAFETRVKAYIFGSRVSGIGFPDSDVDVFADTGNMYSGNHGQEVSVQKYIVMLTRNILKAHPDCEQVNPVPTARTPIVKLKYKPTNTYCDIAFRHGLGCENTKLIRFYLSLDPSIKPLIGFLKFWMQANGLAGPERFTSYASVWLVIFFLQQLPDINFPTVEELQTGVEAYVIAGWLCSFSVDRSALAFKRIPHTMLQLVCEFFKFYNKFDFETFVVCPLTGKPEPKTFFKKHLQNLPDSMQEYVKQLNSSLCEKLSVSFCCVQDPFELNHNVSKAASHKTVERFQNLCGLSIQLCSKLENEGYKFES